MVAAAGGSVFIIVFLWPAYRYRYERHYGRTDGRTDAVPVPEIQFRKFRVVLLIFLFI